MIKVKKVGRWKIGDIVFKDDPRWIEIGIRSSPTPAGWEIIKFSQDKKNATVRLLMHDRSVVTCPVEKLQEYGGSPHQFIV